MKRIREDSFKEETESNIFSYSKQIKKGPGWCPQFPPQKYQWSDKAYKHSCNARHAGSLQKDCTNYN